MERGQNVKNVLITGADSFVGAYVQSYLERWPKKYRVQTVGTVNGEWKEQNMSAFDTVFHVAGLAHSDTGRVTEEIRKKYYAVNTVLASAVAKKAKSEGVKQFIFMSSSIVYGNPAPVGKQKIIRRDTPCSPANFYGNSKVQAEKRLLTLADNGFGVVLLRCPMIYGRGCRGNFPVLERLALKLSLFPETGNKRSMLYVGNLAEFVRLMIENEESGIFWPCNKEQAGTGELVRLIAACNGKKVALVPGFGPALKLLSHFTGYVDKAFGSLVYEEHLGDYRKEYRLYTLEQSIKETQWQKKRR